MTQMENAIEIIPGRLYWAEMPSLPGPLPEETQNTHYFCTDISYVYEAFFKDFGPLNLGLVWKYCKELEAKFSDPSLQGKRIVHVCSQDPGKRANAACLICAYQVIVLGKSSSMSFEPFVGIAPPFVPFRDALCNAATFDLHIVDVLEGLVYSIEQKWFDWTRFDVRSYEYFSKVQNGDMNVVVPGKFLAFCGPSPNSVDADGYPAFMPEDYVQMFRKAGITLVVRLNKRQYDKRRFTTNGLKHLDLFFPDGSCPPETIVSRFLKATETEPGGVAVHCKAGLGRTGTLIGLYAMKHYFIPARAFIGWIRLCRPGSVLGPQQQYLCDMQHSMFQAGLAARGLADSLAPDTPELPPKEDLESLAEKTATMSLRGTRHQGVLDTRVDVGQGERLCNAKRCSQASSPANSDSTTATFRSVKSSSSESSSQDPVLTGADVQTKPTRIMSKASTNTSLDQQDVHSDDATESSQEV